MQPLLNFNIVHSKKLSSYRSDLKLYEATNTNIIIIAKIYITNIKRNDKTTKSNHNVEDKKCCCGVKTKPTILIL